MTERRAPTTRPRGDFGVRGMEGQWWCAGKVLREVANGWSSMQQLKAWWLVRFLQNVREKIEKRGKESLRNELFSKLLNSDVDIGTPSIGSTLTQERLKNKKLLVALDDVDDSDQIHCMGIKLFGYGSIIIITSRDRQVLKSGGADTILEVKGLNENNSLQLFSTFAFKQLNPPIHFQNLSRRFVMYTQGSPLALRVLGSDLYERNKDYWNSKVEMLKDGPPDEQILEVLKSSYDGLSELEKNIFLDIVCLFKGETIGKTKLILSNSYKGVECGIIKLVDKRLISVSSIPGVIDAMRIDIISQESKSLGEDSRLWCHDMLEEMGKDIVSQESKSPGERSRLWCHKDVDQILKYYKNLVNLREIDLTYCKNLRMLPNLSEAINLELLRCTGCESLVELWNEVGHSTGPVNLREIHLGQCVNLRKIPYFSRAIKLEILDCSNCENLVELWNEDDHMGLANIRQIHFCGCVNLRKIPNFSRAINFEILDCSYGESLVELWNEDDHMGLVNIRQIRFCGCVNLRKIPNFSRAINFEILDCSYGESLVELWNEDDHMGLVNLRRICFDGCVNLRKIPNLSSAIKLQIFECSNCESLVEL
ncbi:disease resistance protein TAO1-like [Gossypium hirsutum]|uniref:Disease resistance protein TAO1-like n=1 Tax=Gossypium hirsutum TaxID=3635 RepID=A0ABM2YVQ2_GOSHI|nr:disease resistance protein TAO1-like [Gossypium hirsutum]